jgi:hypothetical protein
MEPRPEAIQERPVLVTRRDRWRYPESDWVSNACRARSVPYLLPPCAGPPLYEGRRLGVHCGVIKLTHIEVLRTGTRFRTRRVGFGDPLLPSSYPPIQLESRPAGFPLLDGSWS